MPGYWIHWTPTVFSNPFVGRHNHHPLVGIMVLFGGKRCIWKRQKPNMLQRNWLDAQGNFWVLFGFMQSTICFNQRTYLCSVDIALQPSSLEHKSGLEFTAACCKLPMTARSDCPSSSVTTSSVCNLRLRDRVKALMSLTYWLWSTVMEESGFWESLKPVKVNSLLLRDPKRNFCSNCRNFSWNTWFPQHKP